MHMKRGLITLYTTQGRIQGGALGACAAPPTHVANADIACEAPLFVVKNLLSHYLPGMLVQILTVCACIFIGYPTRTMHDKGCGQCFEGVA